MLGRELELVAVAIVLKETVASRLEGGGVGGTEGEGWEEMGDEKEKRTSCGGIYWAGGRMGARSGKTEEGGHCTRSVA